MLYLVSLREQLTVISLAQLYRSCTEEEELGLLDKPVEFRGARSDRVVVPHLAYISPSIEFVNSQGTDELMLVTGPVRIALRIRAQ